MQDIKHDGIIPAASFGKYVDKPLLQHEPKLRLYSILRQIIVFRHKPGCRLEGGRFGMALRVPQIFQKRDPAGLMGLAGKRKPDAPVGDPQLYCR